VLVLTSPIYFGEVSGQLKCFIDRTYSFLRPDYMTNPNPSRLSPGKKAVFVLTQGSPDAGSFDVFKDYSVFFKWLGYDSEVIRGVGLGAPTDAAGKPELMKQAEETAKKVMG